jgi:phosphoribosylformylglycinamidine synthase
MKARFEIFLKPGVLDVQGKAIEGALHGLGFSAVGDVRVGRLVTLRLDSSEQAEALQQARSMADRLLANPVIESCRVEIEP